MNADNRDPNEKGCHNQTTGEVKSDSIIKPKHVLHDPLVREWLHQVYPQRSSLLGRIKSAFLSFVQKPKPSTDKKADSFPVVSKRFSTTLWL